MYKYNLLNKLKLMAFWFFLWAFIIPIFFPVFAHILLTDGSIGAVVHINPDDDPVVGQNADFFFEFKDKENKFNPQNCDCQYQITLGDKQIASGDLFGSITDPSLDQASFSLVFPEKGVYTITLIGKPKNPGEFNQFQLKDSVRVERTTDAPTETASQGNFFTNHSIHFLVFGTGLGIFFILLFFKIKNPS